MYGEVKLEDLDVMIKTEMDSMINEAERLNYENSLNKAISEYFLLTGTDYFSSYFENELLMYKFKLKDAYQIKELFLKKIIIDNTRENLKEELDSIIYSYFSKSNSLLRLEEDIYLDGDGDSYFYYDSMDIAKKIKNRKYNRKTKNTNKNFIKFQSEELGSDEGDYEDQLNFEREILGDF